MANVGYAQGSREKMCGGRRVFHPRRSAQGVRVANSAVDRDKPEGDAVDAREEEDEEVDGGARRREDGDMVSSSSESDPDPQMMRTHTW